MSDNWREPNCKDIPEGDKMMIRGEQPGLFGNHNACIIESSDGSLYKAIWSRGNWPHGGEYKKGFRTESFSQEQLQSRLALLNMNLRPEETPYTSA